MNDKSQDQEKLHGITLDLQTPPRTAQPLEGHDAEASCGAAGRTASGAYTCLGYAYSNI